MTLAIVSALPEELAAIDAALHTTRTESLAGRQWRFGRLGDEEVVLCLAGVGKVAAATTTALLLDRFAVRSLLFTGVAGGLGPGVAVGDVVVGREFLQHDMDASPLFPRWEVPLTGRSRFGADAPWADRLAAGARRVLAQPHAALAGFGIVQAPALHQGLILSGDQFIASGAVCRRLQAELPDALAVEMEGAAIAQVCADFDRPFAVLRTISDRADDQAHVDFPRFLREVAAPYSRDIVMATLQGA
ncbi:5'-methylthioadenosine/adenosylhomocysteine nucleosidase [Ideonella livida]|uniref:adenosylhomocysteine nucleosidase n=1 Tax=Ideonella livida TaxID=2707176 RepID=A0A7C9PH95_9BURK|nr:5'-methylthioadenosine/adenosylhomocysteine nucleosidase [Ideonella livida]NDY90994.1 5'-methylthioadenosine/adenosylhomocysteine nucleosidase [Ideonella livida]